MHDPPTAAELITAVRDCLRDEIAPDLQGRKLFLARVAMNALEIVARELEMDAEHAARELAGLKALLGRDGTREELNRELCRRIRARAVSLYDPDLIRHLRSVTLDKISVDQPKYSSYQAVQAKKA